MKILLVIVVGSLLISCAVQNPPSSQLTSTAFPNPALSPNLTTPRQVVKAMYSALNKGDVNGALSYFTDDAIYVVQRGPSKGLYIGKGEIRPLLEPDAKNGITSEISNFEYGLNVVEMQHDRIQDAEAITSEILLIAVVNEKITGVGVNPESLVRFLADTLNDRKTDRAMRLFADNPDCALASDNPLRGKQAVQTALQQYVDAGDVFEVNNVEAVEYYKVTWILKIYDPHGKVIAQVPRLSTVKNGLLLDCVPIQ
jgi:hypothetical protein